MTNKRGRAKLAKDTDSRIEEMTHRMQRLEQERDELRYELDQEREEARLWRERALETEAKLNSFVKKIAQQMQISPHNIEAKFVEENEEEEGERAGDSLVNFGHFKARTYQKDVQEEKKHFKIKIVILDECDDGDPRHEQLRAITS